MRNHRRYIDQLPLLRSRRRDSWDGLSDIDFKVIETVNLEPIPDQRAPSALKIVRVDFGDQVDRCTLRHSMRLPT
jgi:hypothetical protein